MLGYILSARDVEVPIFVECADKMNRSFEYDFTRLAKRITHKSRFAGYLLEECTRGLIAINGAARFKSDILVEASMDLMDYAMLRGMGGEEIRRVRRKCRQDLRLLLTAEFRQRTNPRTVRLADRAYISDEYCSIVFNRETARCLINEARRTEAHRGDEIP